MFFWNINNRAEEMLIMTGILLSDLSTKQQTWIIKVNVMRRWESINNSIGELMSLDMILMDVKVIFSCYFV
jgi:hypothetical protein